MKLKFTGNAEAAVTYLGRFEVTTGSTVEAESGDANALLQTGAFQVVEEDVKPKASESKKSEDSSADDKTDDSKKK